MTNTGSRHPKTFHNQIAMELQQISINNTGNDLHRHRHKPTETNSKPNVIGCIRLSNGASDQAKSTKTAVEHEHNPTGIK